MREYWYVYMLVCSDGSFYIGATNNVQKRVRAHNAGKGGAYTRSHLPVRVVYTERCSSHGHALRREAALKRLRHTEKARLFL